MKILNIVCHLGGGIGTTLKNFFESDAKNEHIVACLNPYDSRSETLHNIENIDRMYKSPDENVGNPHFVLKDMVLDKLLDAFVGILTKVYKEDIIEEPKKIQKDRFTVADKIISTRNILKEKKELVFEELFEEGQTKSELINIFLALLELLK